MKVHELITRLKQLHPDLDVWVAMNDEYASELEPDGVWVGDPSPGWKAGESADRSVAVISDIGKLR